MEIKFKQGDSVAIPEGCKAVVNNRVVVFEKEGVEFKDGDILHSNIDDVQVIFKNISYNGHFDSYYNNINFDDEGWSLKMFRYSTEEEKQSFFDKMKEQGLRWNAEEKRVEKIRWRAKCGEEYHYIDSRGNVIVDYDLRGIICGERLKFGNYFCTREQSEKAAEAVKETLRKFHEENE